MKIIFAVAKVIFNLVKKLFIFFPFGFVECPVSDRIFIVASGLTINLVYVGNLNEGKVQKREANPI